jgi:hypothetical protein
MSWADQPLGGLMNPMAKMMMAARITSRVARALAGLAERLAELKAAGPESTRPARKTIEPIVARVSPQQ